MTEIDPNRCVFLDEAGILTNMTRRYARAQIGQRAVGSAPATWKRLTVLGALSGGGVVQVKTVETGTTIPVFVDFLKSDLEAVCRRQAQTSSVMRRLRRRDRMETKAIWTKATRCSLVRSKIVFNRR
jgi:hypothetical protein